MLTLVLGFALVLPTHVIYQLGVPRKNFWCVLNSPLLHCAKLCSQYLIEYIFAERVRYVIECIELAVGRDFGRPVSLSDNTICVY